MNKVSIDSLLDYWVWSVKMTGCFFFKSYYILGKFSLVTTIVEYKVKIHKYIVEECYLCLVA